MPVNVGEVTVQIKPEMTDTSKQVIRGVVAEVLREALQEEGAIVPFASQDALKDFIRAEVHKALQEMRLLAGIPGRIRPDLEQK